MKKWKKTYDIFQYVQNIDKKEKTRIRTFIIQNIMFPTTRTWMKIVSLIYFLFILKWKKQTWNIFSQE